MSSEDRGESINWSHCTGIFLFSLATLLLELSLTRVLSVALWYHFGFLIISTALLGFGTSGVVLSLWRGLREEYPLDQALTVLAMLFGVLTIVCFWLMQRIPFDPFNVVLDRRQLVFMPLYYLVIGAPFFCSGLALALLFTRGTRQINRLYAFDLVGAGVGCVSLAVVMPKFGGSGSVVFAAMLGMLAAADFAFAQTRKLAAVCLAFCFGLLALSFVADRVLPINVTTLKNPLPYPPILTAWNTFSRIDVFERPGNAEKGFPAMRRFVYDAGTAATGSQDLRPNVHDYLSKNTDDKDYLSGIAYLGKQKPSVLVIGSGGGAEVLDALHFGARSVTAVEINPIINDVVSGSMNDFWGGMFRLPEVKLVTEEGRSFVRRSRETYDAIISVHTISNAAVASGALSLSENYVLTREAFDDYFDHLAPDGVIYFTRPESHIGRLFAMAREALERRGVANPAAHFYAYRIPPDDWEKERFGENRPAFEAGFLVKKAPFTLDEQRRMETLLGVGQQPRDAGRPAPETLYSLAEPHAGSLLHTILTTPDLPAFYQTQVRQYEPATDDRPFFNHHTRWSSINWQTVRELVTHKKLGMLMLGDLPVAEISLLVLLAQTILLAAALIFLPLARFSRTGLNVPRRWNYLLYFAALGFGFITIEMALLSHFTLFLGQPVYTYAVILASLLVFTGLGAHLTGRFDSDPLRAISVAVLMLLAILLLTALVMPYLFAAALGLTLWLRIVLAVCVLAPLGIALGMPFPLGLRLVSDEADALVAWSWGVNGFFTVIGTVTALMLGMTFGFKLVLLVGAVAYLLALGAISRPKVSQLLPLSIRKEVSYEN